MKEVTRTTIIDRHRKFVISYELMIPETPKEWVEHLGKLMMQHLLEQAYFIRAHITVKMLYKKEVHTVGEIVQKMREYKG